MENNKDYLNVPIDPTPTPAMIREAQPEKEVPTIRSLLGGAWEDSTSYAALLRWYETPNEVDPTFSVTKELLDRHTLDLPTEYVEELADSTNETQFMMRVKSMKDRLKTREGLAANGYGGMAASFGMAMLDPTFLVAAPVASFGLFGKATQTGIATKRALRARAAVRGLALAGVVDLPIETGRYLMDDMAEIEHLFINTAASAVFGSALGAAFPTTAGFRKSWKKQVELERVRIAHQMVKDNGGKIVKGGTEASQIAKTEALRTIADDLGLSTVSVVDGKTTYKSFDELQTDVLRHFDENSEQNFDTVYQEVMDLSYNELIRQSKDARVETVRFGTEFEGENWGKELTRDVDDMQADLIEARINEAEPINQAREAYRKAIGDSFEDTRLAIPDVEDYVDELAKMSNVPPRGWVAEALYFALPWQRPWAIYAMKSANTNLKRWGFVGFEDPTLQPARTAETYVKLNNSLALEKFRNKRVAIKRTGGKEALDDFDSNVAKAIRGREDVDGMFGEAAAEIRTFFKEIADYGARSGIKAFQDLVRNPDYIPREAYKKAVDAALAQDPDLVLRLLENSLKKANKNMGEKKVKATAKAWLKYASDPDGYSNARLLSSTKNTDRVTAMESILDGAGLNREEIDDVLDLFMPKSNDPHIGMTNRRINFDESHFETFEDGTKLYFSDLLVNDMTYLMEKHARRVIGASEITKMAKALGIKKKGKGDVPTFDDMTRWLKEGGEVSEQELRAFEMSYRHLMGLGQEDLLKVGVNTKNVSEFLTDLSFINSMGNVGLAQLPEAYNSAASTGLVAMLQSMPMLSKLTRNSRNGELNDEFAQSIAEFIGAGEMLEGGHSVGHKTRDSSGITRDSDHLVGKTMNTLRGVTSGSTQVKIGNLYVPLNPLGIAPIDEALRMGHVRGTLQDWVNKAYDVKNGKPIKNTFYSKTLDRFRDLGFTTDELNEVMEALSDPSVITTTPGITSGRTIAKLEWMNIKPKVRMKLQFALLRDADRVIQRNNFGNLSPWMMTPTGGMIMQFRKFAANATYKQLAYNMKHSDGKAINTFLGTAFVGYLGYVVNTHISSLKYDKHERKKFLKNAFGEKEFMGMNIPGGKNTIAAVIRTGAAGSLPMYIDPITSLFDPDEQSLLNPYRTSGQRVGFLEGIPTVGLVRNAVESGKDLTRAGLNIGGGIFGVDAGEPLNRAMVDRMARLSPMRNTVILNMFLNKLLDATGLPNK